MKMVAYKHAYIHVQHRQLQKYKCRIEFVDVY